MRGILVRGSYIPHLAAHLRDLVLVLMDLPARLQGGGHSFLLQNGQLAFAGRSPEASGAGNECGYALFCRRVLLLVPRSCGARSTPVFIGHDEVEREMPGLATYTAGIAQTYTTTKTIGPSLFMLD